MNKNNNVGINIESPKYEWNATKEGNHNTGNGYAK
jgi:hypothetical protein